jgi:hypothetical protein
MTITVGVGVIVLGVVIGTAMTVFSCGGLAVASSIVIGGFMGAGMELIMQGIEGKTLQEVNYLKVAVSAVSGALCAIPGVGWFGAVLIGGATQAVMTAIDGGSLEECLISFAVGVAIGVALHFGAKALRAVGKKLAAKLGFCFVAGTGILLANGTIKNIEDIQVGDRVKSYNEITKQIEYKTVTETFTSRQSEVIKITTSGNQTITVSTEHPFYVQGFGFIPASQLRAGDVLRTVDGKTVVVEQVQHELLEMPITMYNFEVQDNHNYFVSQDGDSVLVNNVCPLKIENLRRSAVAKAWRQEKKNS